MSLFDSLFSSPKTKYSNIEKYLSEIEIKKLVSRIRIKSLDQKEESLVEQAIIKRRKSDGKISLRQIYEVLTNLMNQGKLSSRNDRDGLMRVFSEWFDKKD